MMKETLDDSPDSMQEDTTSDNDGRTSLTIERRMNIVKAVNIHKTATVAEIAQWLGASPATVRRDLAWLDEQGLLIRTRGGATAIDYSSQVTLHRTTPSYEQRLNEYVEEKRSIGQCAAETIHDGETIILDASTTNHYILPFLAKKHDLTIITNSLYMSQELMTISETHPSMMVICTGGTLFRRSHSFIGMIAEQALSQFYVDKAFIGLRGISLHHGLTSPFSEEIPLKRQMIKCAQQVFILADHTKLNRTSANLIAPLNVVHTLITDAHANPESIRQIQSAVTRVLIAPLIEDTNTTAR